ncbi:GNAT family N-acetyltransferase [Nocardioides cavernae]|uniref:GNAT family N-acetyltransferase n=1 Tax=Nocardioides cavernae TaxID=1921566 RepID=A0ABR8NFG2_9ACTN|nr:GNAT family N-acetyltransferase [Nocardioides cavernae]MBD3926858.1 GNAT family N-acetyltransferase [Nocardioides cavernae]MBM7512580.1 GNAT superfamily N-acetyltransferase [Nocardioides cavernae]
MADGLVLRPMTQHEYDTYRTRSVQDYAREIAEARGLDPADALATAEGEFAELLPDGLPSPGMHLWTAVTGDGEAVGLGWLELRRKTSGVSAWVYDVHLDADRRGQGLGRQLMEALHEQARELGATTIALNVFGHNTAAIRLYDSLGYAVTAQQMRRDL